MQEVGIETTEAGLCWLASLDMALSGFNIDRQQRVRFLTDITKDLHTFNLLGDQIGLKPDKIPDLVQILQEKINKDQLAVEISYTDTPSYDDFYAKLVQNEVIIFGEAYQQPDGKWFGHMMVMDKVLQNGNDLVFAYYDPAVPDPVFGRKYVSPLQLYWRQQDEKATAALMPFLISFATKGKR